MKEVAVLAVLPSSPPPVRRPFPDASPPERESGSCEFCGLELAGESARCPRCGALQGAAAEDLRRAGERRRAELGIRKRRADLLFLGGLLAGGPLLSFGLAPRVGLFLILAGGVASTARRYTDWSTPGTLATGGLLAAVLASAIMEPGEPGGAPSADAHARSAFVEVLAERWAVDGVRVEARGPELSVVWLHVPAADAGACGSFPSPEVRGHLGELGVRRLVVAGQESEEGVCTFSP